MTAAAANYVAGATRCKKTWDDSFRHCDEGGRLTERELVEMHGAGLGLIWTTHTTDLPSALTTLRDAEAQWGSAR
jgi:hypothetical protein